MFRTSPHSLARLFHLAGYILVDPLTEFPPEFRFKVATNARKVRIYLGLNARAALITRGLAEIARFGVALGGQAQTFMGLAGMGDLILTCTGDLSRNRRVGLELAAGKTLAQILLDLGHVAEGVSTTREVARLSEQLGIEMPITEAVNAILYHDEPASSAVDRLLNRDPKSEAS